MSKHKKIVTAVPAMGEIRPPGTVRTRDEHTLFHRIAEEILVGERKFFDNLKPAERKMVLEWLADAIVDGNAENALHNVLWETDYVRKPVGIEEFIQNDYYLGQICRELRKHWVRDLMTIFTPGSTISEWIVTGALGTGKTVSAMIALVYAIYLMSCLRNPAKYYNLLPMSIIVFGIYSITKTQVSDTGYAVAKSYIDTSPYFQSDFPRSTKIDSKVVFTKQRMQLITGSREFHAVGLNMFSFGMDEANFMSVRRDPDYGTMVGQAHSIYDSTQRRLASRFMRPGGLVPGITLLISSKSATTSFLEQRLQKICGRKNIEGVRGQVSDTTYVSTYSQWDGQEDKYKKPSFRVETGDRVSRSRILKANEKPRPGSRVISVPGDFRQQFKSDTDQALRDIAGVATFNMSPLVHDRESVQEAIRTHYKHPFKREVITLNYQDDVRLEDYFDLKLACAVSGGRWRFRQNPNRPRFIHVDLSLTGDCAGFAMSHLSANVVRRIERPDGTYSMEEKPFIIYDILLRIMPPQGSQIGLAKIRQFILYLHNIVTIKHVSFDGFQSADSIQLLNRAGISAGPLSMDKSEIPYLTLQSALSDRRVVYYDYEPFISEVLDLERDIKEGKIDHPVTGSNGLKGSKDVADAAAGALWWPTTDPAAGGDMPVPIVEQGSIDTVSKEKDKPVEKDPAAPPQIQVAPVKIRDGRVFDWDKLRHNLAGARK